MTAADVDELRRERDELRAERDDLAFRLGAEVATRSAALDLIRSIAESDPEGTVDYGCGSEYTGPYGITGCIYCREEFMGWKDGWKHKPECVWRRAVDLIAKVKK